MITLAARTTTEFKASMASGSQMAAQRLEIHRQLLGGRSHTALAVGLKMFISESMTLMRCGPAPQHSSSSGRGGA